MTQANISFLANNHFFSSVLFFCVFVFEKQAGNKKKTQVCKKRVSHPQPKSNIDLNVLKKKKRHDKKRLQQRVVVNNKGRAYTAKVGDLHEAFSEGCEPPIKSSYMGK